MPAADWACGRIEPSAWIGACGTGLAYGWIGACGGLVPVVGLESLIVPRQFYPIL